jgi:hypothetical protein
LNRKGAGKRAPHSGRIGSAPRRGRAVRYCVQCHHLPSPQMQMQAVAPRGRTDDPAHALDNTVTAPQIFARRPSSKRRRSCSCCNTMLGLRGGDRWKPIANQRQGFGWRWFVQWCEAFTVMTGLSFRAEPPAVPRSHRTTASRSGSLPDESCATRNAPSTGMLRCLQSSTRLPGTRAL